MQNREWGVMITWDYTGYPYIESGTQLYQDMVLAYNNGAKYIIIFDANQGHIGSTLQPEHFQALQQFWQYIHTNPRNTHPINTRTAYVMPNGYGFGFRGPSDKVWGLTDSTSDTYFASANSLLNLYGNKLDIIYDDGLTADNTSQYNSVIYYYNYVPPTPSPSPTPSPTQTPSPSPSPTESPSQTPTPSPTPMPTTSPTQSLFPSPPPSPSPTLQPTSSPDSQPEWAVTTSDVFVGLAIMLSFAAVSGVFLIKKRRST